ncbi:MAG: YicC/YloC family endoribonuclease [Bacteroides sp.]|nr:YicC/YloC family endoribonuclease [Bacteroides sp.]
MIQSMTGYGKATVELPDKKVNIEIKSLNSKAMDLSARIAPLYREKEMEIRNEISKTLERGKVDFSLWIEKKESAESATPINQALVEGYYKQILSISENLGIPVPNTTDWFATLLRLPDVMTKNENQELTEEEWNLVRVAVEEAIRQLVEFRKQEGAALEKKFREKITNISQLLEAVEPYEKERVSKIKERITDALEKTLSIDYDKNRLEQELIYYIEKLDVNEEKQRLGNHLKYFINTLETGSGQGKKLGFIAQEMGREINTLGSKSNHAEMQKIVVQMKDELEQIKEQVLNVM